MVMISISVLYVQQPTEDLLDAYGNSFEIQGLNTFHVALVLLAGGALGFLGALVSVQRYLRQLRVSGRLGRI